MRTRHLAFGAFVATVTACGGAGNDAAALDTAASAPTDSQHVEPDEAVIDTGIPPTRDTTPPSSGGTSPRGSGVATAAPIAGADTAAGVVALIGPALDARVVVQTKGGPVAVIGDQAQIIGRLQGMDIWAQGPLSVSLGREIPPRQITVQRFEVRAAAGVPAIDGTLRDDAGTLIVVSADGARARLTSPPSGLRELVGRRVWVTRASDGAVASFGEIR